jgi:hypothetical protein
VEGDREAGRKHTKVMDGGCGEGRGEAQVGRFAWSFMCSSDGLEENVCLLISATEDTVITSVPEVHYFLRLRHVGGRRANIGAEGMATVYRVSRVQLCAGTHTLPGTRKCSDSVIVR